MSTFRAIGVVRHVAEAVYATVDTGRSMKTLEVVFHLPSGMNNVYGAIRRMMARSWAAISDDLSSGEKPDYGHRCRLQYCSE